MIEYLVYIPVLGLFLYFLYTRIIRLVIIRRDY